MTSFAHDIGISRVPVLHENSKQKIVCSTPISENQIKVYLKKYGSQTTSYFHTQPDIDYFHVQNVGFVSYKHQKGLLSKLNIVFAKPVCRHENLEYLIDAYLAKSQCPTVFISADLELADLLHQKGFDVNDIGSDFIMPLDSYKVSGRKMRHLRSAANLHKHGLVVKEQSWADIDAEEVRAISHAWMGAKKVTHGEIRVMTRPPKFEAEWDVRKFYCYQGKKLLGFVFFDPFFENGKTIGYTANIVRCWPDAKPNGLLDFIILEAMKKFKAEGVQYLSLGLSPLYNIEPDKRENRHLRRLLNFIWNYGNFFYSFKDLAFHKTRFRAPEQKLFACIRRDVNPILGLFQLAFACGVIPPRRKKLHAYR